MEEKKSYTDEDRLIVDLEDRELWFSSLAADESTVYDADAAFDHFLSRIRRKKPRPLMWFLRGAAAVATLLVVSSLSYWWGDRQLKGRFADVSVTAPLGAKTHVVLPDSTLVWLNAGSRIVYSQGFGVSDRRLRLNGEAYFEVRKNEELPFDVITKELNVRVLGTKFNFRNYEEDGEASVDLLEGKVRLENRVGEREINYLAPSEKMTLDKRTGKMSFLRVNTLSAKGWTDDNLFFDEESLNEIARVLGRSYNVRIHIADNSLGEVRFYGHFNRKSQGIYEVLDMITATNQLDYKVEGDSILLYAPLTE